MVCMLRFTFLVCLLLPIAAVAAAEEEESQRVFRTVAPSVVVVENAEASASGLVVDGSGLVLTSAHLLASPLPLCVKIEVPSQAAPKTLECRRVRVVSVHTAYDLALLRLDPAEHGITFVPVRFHREPCTPGKTVYAIGNPRSFTIALARTITTGMLSAVDRMIEGVPYLQVSAQVNAGSDGGAVCDKTGAVLGVVTCKAEETEGIAFAVPASALQLKDFTPLTRRPPDPERAKMLGDEAEKVVQLARKIPEATDPRRVQLIAVALVLYRCALLAEPDQWTMYYNTGLMQRWAERPEVAVAYLAKSIAMSPWGAADARQYRELAFGLDMLQRNEDALVVRREGVAKYPVDSGQLWEDLAVVFHRRQDFLEAAYAAHRGVHLGKVREQVLTHLIKDAEGRLDAEQRASLDRRLAGMPDEIRAQRTVAIQAKKDGVPALLPEFAELLRRTAPQAMETDTGAVPDFLAAEATAAPPEQPDSEAATAEPTPAAWIRSRISVARNFGKNGNRAKAREVLQEVIARYPDVPETEDARTMLRQMR